jgi:putative transposase
MGFVASKQDSYRAGLPVPTASDLPLKEQDYLPMNSKIASAAIHEQAGRWFVSVTVHEERTEPTQATGQIIGVDLGSKTLATASDGRVFENPKALRKKLNALKRASGNHSRKKKGSKKRQKAKAGLSRMPARIANVRQDALHKATTALVARPKPDEQPPCCIVLEDLNV